jgi:hypothetical protein
MVNILDFTNDQGETLQINQVELRTEEGKQRVFDHMNQNYEEYFAILDQEENCDTGEQ